MVNTVLNVEIAERAIGPQEPVYIVAELSANHNQDFGQAVELVYAAQNAGADAVKLQTYTADSLTANCNNEYFRVGKGTVWEGRTLYDLYSQAFTPWNWQPKLKQVADDLGMHLFSSPFDFRAVEFLEQMEVPAYKIASSEIIDLRLIGRAAQTGKPIIISTGMASQAEIEDAVRTVREAGNSQIVLLKCTSAYPASPEEMNLCLIPHLSQTFGVPVGLSDHTLDTTVPVVAAAVGACMIEKHLTLSRSVAGPDSEFSLEPAEFKAMVDAVRTTRKALGELKFGPTPAEAATLSLRRSLFVVVDVKAGERFTDENVRSIRPGHGLPPKNIDQILGRPALRDISQGTPLTWADVVRK
jgi:pseudaminic acid synthase